MTDPISETDLLAYVDEQLDAERKIEVEEYLAGNPEAAARIMADLKDRDTLRLIHATPLPRPAETMIEAAARLDRSLDWQDFGRKFRRVAAIALLVGFGWFAHGQVGLGVSDSEAAPKPPSFVEDAVHSHATSLLRARMMSQRETNSFDAAEIRTETGIELPKLPGGWLVRDVQVFPSRHGHSIEVAIDAGALGRVSLFAAQVPTFNVIAPTLAQLDKTRAVYWQRGPLAYALTGIGSEEALERAAARLANEL